MGKPMVGCSVEVGLFCPPRPKELVERAAVFGLSVGAIGKDNGNGILNFKAGHSVSAMSIGPVTVERAGALGAQPTHLLLIFNGNHLPILADHGNREDKRKDVAHAAFGPSIRLDPRRATAGQPPP
jgi:hypothetical protein